MDERGLKLMRDIVAKNGISVRKGHALLANLVASGEVPVAITGYLDEIEGLKKAGAPVDYAFVPPTVVMQPRMFFGSSAVVSAFVSLFAGTLTQRSATSCAIAFLRPASLRQNVSLAR